VWELHVNEDLKGINVSYLKIVVAALNVRTDFAFQQNVIRFINVELEDGVMKAFVEITIISA
jgi:hypothetical protein